MALNHQYIFSFDQWLMDCGYAAKTRQKYLHLFAHFCDFINEAYPDWKPLVDYHEDQVVVETYHRCLRQEALFKQATVNAALCVVARFFSMQGCNRRFGLMQASSMSVPERLNKEELEKLSATLEFCSLKHRCIVMLFLHAGLRPRELSDLRFSDVSVSHESMVLLVGSGKTRREIELAPEPRLVLGQWLLQRQDNRPTSDDYLFLNVHEQVMSGASLDLIVKNVGQRSRLLLSARLLRNTFIRHLIESEDSLLRIVRLAGLNDVASVWRHLGEPEEAKRLYS